MKKPIKRILIAVALLVVAIVACMGFRVWRVVSRGIPDAYAAWDCATLIVEYMDTHDGVWPKSWEDVFSAAETLPRGDRALRGHSINNLDQIALRVRVDWNANPRQLAAAKPKGEDIPFHVITRADGSDFPTVWSGKEPNTLIWRHLKEDDFEQNAAPLQPDPRTGQVEGER